MFQFKDKHKWKRLVRVIRRSIVSLLLIASLFNMTACQNPDSKLPSETQEANPKVYVDSYAAGFVSQIEMEAGKSSIDFKALLPEDYELHIKLQEYGHPYEVKDGKFFIFYFQDQEGGEWNDLPHGHNTVAESGCGTVCLSMALTALTGDIERYTPAKIVECELEDHIATPNRSTNSIPVINRCIGSGCKVEYYEGELNFKIVDETLKAGGYVILDQRAKTKGESRKVFGAKNHYIMIRGGSKEEGYYIANPLYGYSRPESPAKFAPQNENLIPASMFAAKYYYTITN